MSKPLCVVFADAFAYGCYKKLGGLSGGYNLRKIIPGIGYSSNLHYLLFEGKNPEKVGFFTDYNWHPAQLTKISLIKRKCDEIMTFNNIYRVVRRKLTKQSDNIPFAESAYFSNKGTYKFMQNGECRVFNRKVDKAYGSDIYESFHLANLFVDQGKDGIIVVLEELDHSGHEVGSSGEKYIKYATEILSETEKLFTKFSELHPEGICIMISDHGMSDVTCTIDVMDGLKKRFGVPGSEYQFYNDSVYLRLWANDLELRGQIKLYLDKISALSFISDEQRKKHGVAALDEFGHLIYRLKEGYAFGPNCFGVAIRGGSRGMHGYMEPTNEASGILVTRILDSKASTIDACDVYDMISKWVAE